MARLDLPCHLAGMTHPYRWTTFADEIPTDAIIVGIAGTSADMLTIGLSYVEPMASIYWPVWFGDAGQVVQPGSEMGPWSVPDALERAEVLRLQFGFPRVVVSMEERGLWCDEWGVLAEDEGYD